MSALNPVLTIGDQISEIVLLHEKKELSTQILSDIQLEKQAAVNMKKIERIPTEKGGYACNGCGAAIQVEQSTCPNCGENIKLRRSYLRNVRLAYDSKFFKMIQENPDSLAIKVCDRIPLVGSYQKRMKQAALNTSIRMLRLVRIPDPQNIVKSFPFELSGGMQQRVMIAMALACKPKLLIADEPTTALDVTIQAQILKLMRELQDEMGTSLLLITHNLGIVAEMCDRIGIMYAGNIVEIAGKNSIFKEPLHPYTQGLMNSIPNVAVQLTRLETIQGNVPNLIKPPSGCRFHTRCPYVMEYCKLNKPENKEVRPGHLVACHLYNGGGSSG